MFKLLILAISIFTLKSALSAQICNLCLNDNCYSPDGIHYYLNASTCNMPLVLEAHSEINNAYRQEYLAPEVVTDYECVDIVTTFVLTEGTKEEFSFKGCVEKGFQNETVRPNPAFIREEQREMFEVCNENQCNMKPIIITDRPPIPPLTCYFCQGENECKENLKKAVCDNVLPTYDALSNFYQKPYRSTGKKEYECFTIDSSLTDSVGSAKNLVYKGCVEKGFDACKLDFSNDHFTKETKKHCKVCPEDLCNNGSNAIVTSFWMIGLSLLLAVNLKSF